MPGKNGLNEKTIHINFTRKKDPRKKVLGEKVLSIAFCEGKNLLRLGLSPFPVIVTDRIMTFIVGDPYKLSFATITGKVSIVRAAIREPVSEFWFV